RRPYAALVDFLVGEAPFVAHPVLVDVGVVARNQAPNFLRAELDLVVTAGRAAGADGWDHAQLPSAHGEAKILGRDRTGRAHVDGIDGVRVGEPLSGRCGQNLAIAACRHGELTLPSHFVAHPDAACAQDAAFLIENDVGSDVEDLLFDDLVDVDAGGLVVP